MRKSDSTQHPVSRRVFLKSTSTAVVGGAALHALSVKGQADPHNARAADSVLNVAGTETQLQSQRLLTGWGYRRGNLGGVWEVWRKVNDDADAWSAVELPHCFNAFDAVDPDGPYYQGPGWYRTRLKIANPFPGGRTLLHFEGAFDRDGIPCLDARNVVRFGVVGDGRLIDNLGTSTAARRVELYNGRAMISLQRKGEIVVSVTSDGLPAAFLRISRKEDDPLTHTKQR